MEVSIRGEKVALSEFRRQVQVAKEKGVAGERAFTPETVEALLDLIDTLKHSFSLEDIVKRFDNKYRAHLQELTSSEMTNDSRIETAKQTALKSLEAEGLALRENTFDWTIWHFVPSEGPSVPKYRVRN